MLSTIFANYANVSYQQLPDSQQVEAGRTVPTRPRAPPAHCPPLIRATLTRNCYNVTSILNTMLRGGGSSQTISCPRFLIPKPIFNMSSPMSTFPPKSLAVTCLLADIIHQTTDVTVLVCPPALGLYSHFLSAPINLVDVSNLDNIIRSYCLRLQLLSLTGPGTDTNRQLLQPQQRGRATGDGQAECGVC